MMAGTAGPVDALVALLHEAVHTLTARLTLGGIRAARAAVCPVEVVAGQGALGHAVCEHRVGRTQRLQGVWEVVGEGQSRAGPLRPDARAGGMCRYI